MWFVRQFDEIPFEKNSIITIGTFDGLHLAHQKIIEEVVSQSKKRNSRSIIVTFDPHPRDIVGKDDSEVKLLTTLQERQEYCEQIGIEWFLVIKFDKTFSQQNYRDFYLNYIINKVGISMIVEGYDHHWGHDRKGNIKALMQLGAEYGFEVLNVEPLTHDGILVNSTIIRNALIAGSVENATELLGRPYSVRGKVIVGNSRGRLLGYPTANLEVDSLRKLIPKDGIYFVKGFIDNNSYYGMASIGVRPTFKDSGMHAIEVHLLDFDQDIYGHELRISFLRHLRDELKFDSADQLVQQMHRDKEISRRLQSEYQNIS